LRHALAFAESCVGMASCKALWPFGVVEAIWPLVTLVVFFLLDPRIAITSALGFSRA
jgi:hypothetical protein